MTDAEQAAQATARVDAAAARLRADLNDWTAWRRGAANGTPHVPQPNNALRHLDMATEADLRTVLDDRKRQAERIARLEDNLSAIRSWTRSRLEVLADRLRDNPDSLVNAGKTAVLDDLTHVLHHLDTIPAPDTTTSGNDQ